MGSMQASYSYDAFGEITAEEETFNNDYKYVGQKGVLSQSLGKPTRVVLVAYAVNIVEFQLSFRCCGVVLTLQAAFRACTG